MVLVMTLDGPKDWETKKEAVKSNKYDLPCWCSFDKEYCDSFSFGTGCKDKSVCKAYLLKRSVEVENEPKTN